MACAVLRRRTDTSRADAGALTIESMKDAGTLRRDLGDLMRLLSELKLSCSTPRANLIDNTPAPQPADALTFQLIKTVSSIIATQCNGLGPKQLFYADKALELMTAVACELEPHKDRLLRAHVEYKGEFGLGDSLDATFKDTLNKFCRVQLNMMRTGSPGDSRFEHPYAPLSSLNEIRKVFGLEQLQSTQGPLREAAIVSVRSVLKSIATSGDLSRSQMRTAWALSSSSSGRKLMAHFFNEAIGTPDTLQHAAAIFGKGWEKLLAGAIRMAPPRVARPLHTWLAGRMIDRVKHDKDLTTA